MTKKLGFTLAEVLITLGIIGVVAAMTIPTLMNQTGQAEFKSGFKKMISTLNQAVTMNVALDNSDFSVMTIASAGAATTDASIYNIFNNRMKVISTATNTAGIGAAASGNYTLFFNDGMAVSWISTSVSCTKAAPCKALVDVNGTKNPNKLVTASGSTVSDQFSILFFDNQVLPNSAAAREVMYNK